MEHGHIETVKMDEGIVYCNVRPVRHNVTYEGVPVLKSHSGFIEMPKQGQQVMMDELSDGTKFIEHVMSRERIMERPDPGEPPKPYRPAEMKEGEMTIRLDKNTHITFKETRKENYDLNIAGSGDINIFAPKNISISSKKGDVSITAQEGDISMSAEEQNISLGAEKGNVSIQGIPFMDHVHDYDDETIDPDGNRTTTTETTDTPK